LTLLRRLHPHAVTPVRIGAECRHQLRLVLPLDELLLFGIGHEDRVLEENQRTSWKKQDMSMRAQLEVLSGR
jgi:hypothetical protein